MKKMIYKNCKYYRQHYLKSCDGNYRNARSGHCTYPRLKLRYGDTPGCAHYKPQSTPAQA